MKKEYSAIQIEIILTNVEDVIRTSPIDTEVEMPDFGEVFE